MPSSGHAESTVQEKPAAAVSRPPLLLLVDGHALVHRAYHAVPPSFMTSHGEPTNAVFGFTSMLLKVVGELTPEYCAVAFDRAAPTFRHVAFADYKATRPRMVDDLRQQFQRVYQVVEALGVPVFQQDGYEADDVLGCLAKQAEEAGVETIILTGDMDLLQLVDDRVRVLAPRGRISETVLYDVAGVREKYGLDPAQIPDFKALSGDSSDNIKGVPGIGAKTAAKLLAEFGTVEQLYARLDAVPAKLREPLAAAEQLVRDNKALTTIERNVPCALNLDDCRVVGYDRQQALGLFQELEFRSLIGRLPATAEEHSLTAAGQDARKQMSFFSDLTGAPPPADEGQQQSSQLISDTAGLQTVVKAIRRAGACVVHPIARQRSAIDFDLAGIALALDGHEAWYLPVAAEDTEIGDRAGFAEPTLLEGLRPILEDEGITKTTHNAKYLYTILAERGVRLRGVGFDTMIGAYLLNPSVRAATVRELIFHQLGREVADTTSLMQKGGSILDVETARVAEAAALEAQLLGQIAAEQRADLEDRAQLDLFERVELPLIPVLSTMERAGVKVDIQVLGAMGRELGEQIQKVEREIYDSVGHQFSINSPQQLGKVLADELHLPLTKRTKTGWSTDVTVLDELAGTHPVIEHILAYRQLTKLKSTYVDALPAMINPRTGRVHTTFNQAVAATGRLSSEAPNLQNIPIRTDLGRRIRRAFVSETAGSQPKLAHGGRDGGKRDIVLLAADYAQIELRIAAHITRDPLLIQAFMDDVDVHAATAATVFSVPLEEVTPDQRRLAKTTNFAVLYGISDFGLSQRVGIARDEAAPFIKAYLDRHTGIKRYIDETLRQAKQRGYVETPLGRRRSLPELRAQNQAVRAAGERMAINMPIQGAQADLIKLAMIAVQRDLEEGGYAARLLLQVHDELVLEVPRSELPAVARLVRERMEGAMTLIVPVKVEMKIGENWYDMEPYHNRDE